MTTSKLCSPEIDACMPLQWSAAYEGLSDLIGIVALNSLFCLSAKFLDQINQIDSASRSISRTSLISDGDDADCHEIESRIRAMKMNFFRYGRHSDEMDVLKNITAALRMEKQWQSTNSATLITAFLTALSPLSRNAIQYDSSVDGVDVARDMEVLHGIQSTLVAVMKEHEAALQYVTYGGVNDIWIVKPVGLSCGEKIVCAMSVQGILVAAKELKYKCVVQKYIERPLLVRTNRKFDIRQWVLVTSADPLVLYGFSECYLRLSGERFSLSTHDLQKPSIHLCNHAIQKQKLSVRARGRGRRKPCGDGDGAGDGDRDDAGDGSGDGDRDEDADWDRDGDGDEGADGPSTGIAASSSTPLYDTMMSQQEFEAELLRLGKARQSLSLSPLQQQQQEQQLGTQHIEELNESIFDYQILPQIKKISQNVILAVRDKLLREGKGFEWLGLDLMVVEREQEQEQGTFECLDRKMKMKRGESSYDVLLLEVNVSPDISPSTPVTERIVGPAVRDLFDLLLGEGGEGGEGGNGGGGGGALEDPLAVTRLDSPRNQSWRAVSSRAGGADSVNNDSGRRVEKASSAGNENGSSRSPQGSDVRSSDACRLSMESTLRWDLWYVGSHRGKRSDIAFSRAKQDKSISKSHCFSSTKTDYLPSDVDVVTAERVLEIILHSSSSSSSSISSSSSSSSSSSTSASSSSGSSSSNSSSSRPVACDTGSESLPLNVKSASTEDEDDDEI